MSDLTRPGWNPPPPPPPPPGPAREHEPFWRRWLVLGLFAVVLLLLVVGIAGAVFGAKKDATGDKPAPLLAATTSTTVRATTTTTTTQPAPTTTVAPTTVAPTTVAPVPPTSPSQVLMPSVPCGTNLQDAQDRIQQAGIFYSRSVDATGRGRSQVLDRNWVVITQTPAPGVPIGEGDAVLTVVKTSEFSGCN